MEKVFKKKILVIMPTLNKCGGIESFFMNYYKLISESYKFDFIVHENDSIEYKKLIENRGDNLYVFPKFNLKNINNIIRKIKKHFKYNHDYDIIHCQMANASLFYLKEAKKYNIKVRIIHSHQCKYADKFTHAIRNYILIKLGKKYATNYMACGEEAGKFMFGNNNYTVMNNAINLKKFEYSKKIRDKMRKQYNFNNDDIIIGNIGRLYPQKNQKFLLEVMSQIIEVDKRYKLIIIGDGYLKQELVDFCKKNNLNNNVLFIDSTSKISDFYQLFDIFALPSLYEGLPVVGVEAQVSGLPCLFSSTITSEIKISNYTEFIDLNNINDWKKKILQTKIIDRDNKVDALKNKKFDIYAQVEKIEKYYDGSAE